MVDYGVIVVLFYAFLVVITGALTLARERHEQRRIRAFMEAVYLLRFTVRAEAAQIRLLLEAQEARRLRSRAREAQVKLHAPTEADAQGRIAVNRIVDAKGMGCHDVPDADLAPMTGVEEMSKE